MHARIKPSKKGGGPSLSLAPFFRNEFSLKKKTANDSKERILQLIFHHPHPKRSTHIMLPTVSVKPVASLELS